MLVLHLGQGNPRHEHRPGEEILGSSPVQNNGCWCMLEDEKLDVNNPFPKTDLFMSFCEKLFLTPHRELLRSKGSKQPNTSGRGCPSGVSNMRVQDNSRGYKAKIISQNSKDNIRIPEEHSVITHCSSFLDALIIASLFTGMQTEKEAEN